MNQSNIKGDSVELQCILDFQKRGYYCSLPFSGSCHYDVVVDINNYLYRIQCKASTYHVDEGVLRVHTSRQSSSDGKAYAYTEDEIDYFYTCWENYGFLIPIKDALTATKCLRIKQPKKGVQKTMGIASDYLLDKVLISILSNKQIDKYIDNRFMITLNGEKKIINTKDYEDYQLKRIKESISKGGLAYGQKWECLKFPAL